MESLFTALCQDLRILHSGGVFVELSFNAVYDEGRSFRAENGLL
jgi:hypothetical protein